MVCEIDERMPSSELTAWLAYYKLEPFGADRDNWHAALLASILVNSNLPKGHSPAEPHQFMYVDQGAKQQSRVQQFVEGIRGLSRKRKG